MAARPIGLGENEQQPAVLLFSGNRGYLLAELGWLRMVLHREVLRLKEANLLSADPFRGLYLSDEQIDALLQSWESEAASQFRAAGKAAELSHRIARVRAVIDARLETDRTESHLLRISHLAALFGLSGFDLLVLVAAAAVEIDQHFEDIFAWVHNDVTRKRPSVGLLLRLFCANDEEQFALRDAFAESSPLLRFRLIRLGEGPQESGASFLSRSVRIDSRVAAYLLGQNGIDLRIESVASLGVPQRGLTSLHLSGSLRARLKNLVKLAEPTICYLRGPRGAGRRAIAEALTAERSRPLLIADLARVARDPSAGPELLFFIQREAAIQEADLFFTHAESLIEEGHALEPLRQTLEAMKPRPGQRIFISGEEPWPARQLDRACAWIALECPIPSYDARAALWREALAEMSYPVDAAVDAAQLANRFALTGGVIRAACTEAERALLLCGEQRACTVRDLEAAARTQSTGGLRRFAEKVDVRGTWESLVLPSRVVRQLRNVCTAERYRQTVYSAWEFDKRLAAGKGINVLFCGSSGTGKTMAAGILSRELGLDLYRIDLSVVVSKYIGETEKQLNLIFREARSSNAVLLFDEADALFGKRSEVKDAHDRYANVEVAYLLQKMEEYEGVVILATNLHRNMDEAFTRRMSHIVDFPFPDATLRERIWRGIFPAAAPMAGDVEFGFLARQFELAGGSIRNIALAAAFLAVEESAPIAMKHCVLATAFEIQKSGKLPSRSEFRDYYELIRAHI
jgi:hypothetical protein